MVYQNQANQQQANSQQSQRSVVASHQAGQHHNSNPLGQYMSQQQQPQQQMQSNAHHGSSGANYYQQHLYQPSYQQSAHAQQDQAAQSQQQQQQHQQSQHPSADYQHHHHPGSNLPVNGPPPTGAVGGVHGGNVHHQQNVTNTQTPGLNHATWSASVSSLGPQTHHPVVTDHSNIAYMPHPYQTHNSTVSDHHRNSNGPMSTQGLNAGHQASSYTVDALYNSASTAAAAVAAAAYGYNDYNAAFFQTSNNGPHSQTGHPSQAAMSTFWNHSQPSAQQPRPAHNQAPTNQNSVQQRQPIVSEQGANYLHDPRMYYGRHTYGQGLPNIAQNQHQAQPQSTDIMHHRMTNLPQLHQMFPHPDLHQVPHQPAIQHPAPIGNQHHQPSSSTTTNQQSLITSHQSTTIQQNQPGSTISTVNDPANEVLPLHPQATGRTPISQIKTGTQPIIQKQISGDNDKLLQSSQGIRNLTEQDHPLDPIGSVPQPIQNTTKSLDVKDDKVFQSNKDTLKRLRDPIANSESTSSKHYTSQNVIKTEPYQNPYHKTKPQLDSNSANQNRAVFKAQSDERPKQNQQNDNSKKVLENEREYRTNADSVKQRTPPPPTAEQSSPDQLSSLEDSISSLTISSPRKTTWASIASQPAKVTQPKSLKSKIAGSTSVLSNAKHLAVVSLDSSSMDSKNGINPAIKSSVSSATTSIQRSSMPPPISKLPAVAACLKLDILGDAIGQNNKISWPAVNASANLQNELLKEKEANKQNAAGNQSSDKKRMDDESTNRPGRGEYTGSDSQYKDHNHNKGGFDSKPPYMMNENQSATREPWVRRGNERNTYRRDSDRDDMSNQHQEDLREVLNARRENNNVPYRPNQAPRGLMMNNHFGRDRDDQYRDRGDRGFIKRGGPMMDRNKPLQRGGNNYPPPPRFQQYNNRFDNRDGPNRHNDNRGPYQPAYRERDRDFRGDRERESRDRDSRDSRDEESLSSSGAGVQVSANSRVHSPPLLDESNYNPKSFDLEPANARYFIIKSYNGDDVHRSIKYSIWCSTPHGNKKLDEAFKQQQAKNGPIYLFFSVNGSGHFCGMAQMTSAVDFDSSTGVWAQSKWQGAFSVKWIYIKDVPNSALRHIILENNEDKPVTNSRDTQEVPSEKGKAVLKIIHHHNHTKSLFDQYQVFERRHEEDRLKRSTHGGPGSDDHGPPDHDSRRHNDDRSDRNLGAGEHGGNIGGAGGGNRFGGRPYMNPRPHNDFQGNHRVPGGRMGGGPHNSRHPITNRDGHMSDKVPYRENGNSRGIKLTQ